MSSPSGQKDKTLWCVSVCVCSYFEKNKKKTWKILKYCTKKENFHAKIGRQTQETFSKRWQVSEMELNLKIAEISNEPKGATSD